MNIPLLRQIQTQIIAHPESFSMDEWDCGTTACILGWAFRLKLEDWEKSSEVRELQILALSETQFNRLCYLSSWPQQFYSPFLNADFDGDKKTAAKIAAARIEHFIETNGRE